MRGGMSGLEELEMLAKDCEELALDAQNSGDEGLKRAHLSIAYRIRHAAKRLPDPAQDAVGCGTLSVQIAAVYERFDAEDCARIDREWANHRGYILPTDGTSKLLPAPSPQEIQEACAQVADRHKGSYARHSNYKNLMRTASDEAIAEIRAEERGEDIAAEMIAKSIRALIPPALVVPSTPRPSPEYCASDSACRYPRCNCEPLVPSTHGEGK